MRINIFVLGAVWVPDDAVINPTAICDTLALLAKKGGAKYIENTTVSKVLTKNNAVYAVETNRGNVFILGTLLGRRR